MAVASGDDDWDQVPQCVGEFERLACPDGHFQARGARERPCDGRHVLETCELPIDNMLSVSWQRFANARSMRLLSTC